MSDAQLTDTSYYATLLRFVGCTATSTMLAGFAGDDVEVRRLGDLVDTSVPREALGFLWTLSRGTGMARPLQTARMLLRVQAVAKEGVAADCQVGARLVGASAFPPRSKRALLHAFERWNGRGAPNGVQR